METRGLHPCRHPALRPRLVAVEAGYGDQFAQEYDEAVEVESVEGPAFRVAEVGGRAERVRTASVAPAHAVLPS